MTDDDEFSILRSRLPLEDKLERARTELLDLSARNRLLNIPKSKTAKQIEIVDERSEHVYRLLAQELKTFTFVPGRAGKTSDVADDDVEVNDFTPGQLDQPEVDELDAGGNLVKHLDTKLQTRLTPTGLQKRLLDLYHDSRTLEEEQGVNILFLALGTLKWIDPNNKENIRFAPLVLVPVSLERGTAGEKFRLKARSDEQTSNLSLEAYLDKVHQLKLPPFEGGDDFNISAYITSIAEAVSTKPSWSVNPNEMTLGFFSFAKFLMYRDLDPNNWPAGAKLTEQPIVRALLGDGFPSSAGLLTDDCSIDEHIPPEDMLHIVDCDSSQALAVHDIRLGNHLIIQGPPGTGKSQTIANVIASAVADGKSVLFVAEKMAALDVVKRRLDAAGVGDACLELHSNKANKRAVLDELRRTWELGAPRGDSSRSVLAGLNEERDLLNAHAARLHEPHGAAGLTAYHVLGSLVRLRAQGQQPTDISIEGARGWKAQDYEQRISLLQDLVLRINDIGLPISHPWWGIGLQTILPTELDRLLPALQSLRSELQNLVKRIHQVAMLFEQPPPETLVTASAAVAVIAQAVASAPDLEPAALGSVLWEENHPQIQELLQAGERYRASLGVAADWIAEGAVDVSISSLADELTRLPADFPESGFLAARDAAELLPRVQAEALRLSRELGTKSSCRTLAEVIRLLSTGECVAVAPDASPEAFASAVWDHGVEQAAELAEAVAALERVRVAIGDRLLEAAWETDVKACRQALATQTGLFRFLSGEWRRAKALARSITRDPTMPIPQVVALLDALSSGQVAIAKLKAGDSFGRSAFGADWRAERSPSAPLLALVEWMRTLRGLGAEPRLVASQLSDRSGVKTRASQLRKLVDQIQPRLLTLWQNLADKTSNFFNDEVSADRVPLNAWSNCTNSWADVDALLKQVMKKRPETMEGIRGAVHQLSALQFLASGIDQSHQLGQGAFGSRYGGRLSDWSGLKAVCDWMGEHRQYRRLAAKLPQRRDLAKSASELAIEARALHDKLVAVAHSLQANHAEIFGAGSMNDTAIALTEKRLDSWLKNGEQLSKWVAYRHQAEKARSAGLAQLVDRMSTGALPTEVAQSTMQMAYFEDLFNEMTEAEPDIARFDGNLHSHSVQRFAQLDRSRIKAASLEVARAHHARIPPRDGGAGPVGVLRGEMAKRRGHMPIRQLMHKAGPAIQAIKPVLMMSPLSVAQFLVPGQHAFDLLVMDEASQIQPVDAIGAVARCKQVVVVGDERQLPPTKFFSKMTGSVPDDEDDGTAQVADVESILGLFAARGLPQRMLRWHYRSRHQSLIAVSNSQFYENKLFIVPSPYTQEAGMGLQFQAVDGGVFDSGGTGTNVVEAKAVAQAVMQHALAHPDLSLGVATFSVAQRRAIQDELELLRRLNPEVEGYFLAHPSEPFFVKNLENVQGDERDVIMISVGYAKNAQGFLAMRFGPLGVDGGERRLNVLISRAKRRCVVYSSITDEDIDLDRAKGRGVFAFKLFLQYARTGRLAMPSSSRKELDGVFEAQVAKALKDAGYQVHARVGIAGIFIDLAIADPAKPGRYLLGIECDGTSYHSARSARDRDRLRQAVLEDHGWIIHRIWSTDWFQRPQEQLQRALAAIESARQTWDERLEGGAKSSRAVPVEIITVDRGDVTEVGLVDLGAGVSAVPPYIEATPQRHPTFELHETPVGFMAEMVAQIVKIEAPIHFDELVVRVRNAWGLQRAGARIEASLERAVEVAHSRGALVRKGSFLVHPSTQPVLRARQSVQSLGLRKPEMIAPEEISVGILNLVKVNLGATDDEIASEVSRRLGFKNTSSVLRRHIGDVVQDLLVNGQLLRKHQMLVAKQ